jgi:general secretion pathway protein N
MKNWKLNITIFVVAYLVFMAVNLPASMIVSKVTLPQGVKLGEVTGSMWSGEISAVQIKNDVLTDVKWQLSPLSLLTGSLSSEVTFGRSKDSSSISGQGGISTNFPMDSFSASDFTLRYPAADFIKKMNLNLPTQIGGRLILTLDNFDQGKPYCTALTGTLAWSKATMQGMGGLIKLGKLDAELGCKAGNVLMKVTKKNPLGLQVTSTLAANRKFTVKGFVKPNGDMPTEVHNAMQFLGKADSKGRFAVNF